MGVFLLVVWLVLPIVFGIMLLGKRTQTKQLNEQLETKERLLDEYRKQNAALQNALRAARGENAPVAPGKVADSAPVVAKEQPVSQVTVDVEKQAELVAETTANATPIPTPEQKEVADLIKSLVGSKEEKAKREKKEKAPKEKKPIPSGVLLFGLGILLVLTAGAIFATTTWNVLPAFGKIAVLLGAVAVFYGSAFIAEKKLKLRNTSITFYILGSTFLAVINLAAGYFKWYGDYYTFGGDGQLMLWCISALITSVCMIVGGVIYKTKILGLLGYYFLLLGTVLGSAFVFEEAVPVVICVGIVLLVSQVFVQLVEYKLDIDVIGTSFAVMSYIWEAVAVSLCIFYFPNIGANPNGTVWDIIAIFVLGIIVLSMSVWRLYQIYKEIILPGYAGAKLIGAVATAFAVVAFVASMRFIPEFYQRTYVALYVFIAAYVAALVLKKKEIYSKSITIVIAIFTECLLPIAVLLGIFISDTSLMGVFGLISAAIVYVIEHMSKNNKFALISAITFFGCATYLVDFNTTMHQYVARVIIAWAIVIIAVVAGRFIYKDIFAKNEDGLLIDWISPASFFAVLYSISNTETEAIEFFVGLALAAYVASYYKRSNYLVDRIILTIATGIAMSTIWFQPFVEIPYDFETEWSIAVALIGTAIVSIIWREYKKYYIFVWVVNIALMFIGEYVTAAEYVSRESAEIIGTFKVVLFLAGIIALFVVSFIKKNKFLLIETGFAMVLYSILSLSADAKGIFILAAVFGIAYLVYLHLEGLSIWAFLPLMQIYVLLFGMDISTAMWLAVFVVVMVAGLALHMRWDSGENRSFADDLVNISGIIPIFAVWADWNDKWIFCAIMMLAIYILSFYKRYDPDSNYIVNKGILTAASIVVAIGWITQPWFEVSSAWKAEWIIFAFMAVCLFNMLVVYKHDTDETWGWITFAVATICIIVQGENAIADSNVVDSLILGTVMLGVVIWSYMVKKKQWFMLSAITLVAQCIYASRKFWISIAWWVYLLVAGAVLIVIAARNEYKKRQGEAEGAYGDGRDDEKRHFFDDWTL